MKTTNTTVANQSQMMSTITGAATEYTFTAKTTTGTAASTTMTNSKTAAATITA